MLLRMSEMSHIKRFTFKCFIKEDNTSAQNEFLYCNTHLMNQYAIYTEIIFEAKTGWASYFIDANMTWN